MRFAFFVLLLLTSMNAHAEKIRLHIWHQMIYAHRQV